MYATIDVMNITQHNLFSFWLSLLMMLLEHLCSPLEFVTTHAFKTESHIVVLLQEASQIHVNYQVDMNVFCRKSQGNAVKYLPCGRGIIFVFFFTFLIFFIFRLVRLDYL